MQIKYNKATINIYGKVDQDKIKEDTIIFMSKVMRGKTDGNNNTSRVIEEKQVLVK